MGESRANAFGILLFLCLLHTACSCESKGTLVAKSDGGAGGLPDDGFGGFIEPGIGGGGGEGGSGGVGGLGGGGAGGALPEPTPCERVCARLEGLCGLEVPGLRPDCLRQCEEALLEEEKLCLASVKCSMEEVNRCLGRPVEPEPEPEPEEHRCVELCPFVYDECGRSMVDGIGLPIQPADCEERCPHLPDPYLDCLEAAANCPAIDACQPEPPPPPPTACEQMCDRVYGTCGSVIDQPGRSYPDRESCVWSCDRGAFTEPEIACLRQVACANLPSCFGGGSPSECEQFCDRVYNECHNAFPIGAHKDDKIDEEACVEACETGEITPAQRQCVEAEACEYAATCFYPVERSCAAACYWVHAWCGFYVQLQRVVVDPFTFDILQFDYPFEAESECHELCQYGFVSYDPPWAAPKSVPAWSSLRKACYRERASAVEPLACHYDGHPYGMNHCALYDPQ